MGELILHIGTRKTGTTALQMFLYNNREVLARNEVDYVEFTPQSSLSYADIRNGVFLVEYCRALALQEEICKSVSDFEENYDRLKEALKGNNRVILSHENFTDIFPLKHDGFEAFWRELARVCRELGPSKTTVIIYLRRQDEYVVSSWKERVKGGYTDKTLREYLSQPETKQELDYETILDTIKKALGTSANIIVRSYNQISATSDGIFLDFCEALGIPWDRDYKVPENRINEAFSFDMIEALRKCSYGMYKPPSNKERELRKKLAFNLCKEYPDPKGTTIFLPEEAEDLMKQYRDGNHRIEEEYMDNQRLFSDEVQEGQLWHPNRLRIAKYRISLMYRILSIKLHSVSKKAKLIIKKFFGSNNKRR